MKRIKGLDGLRGMAVLLVIGYHYINNQLLHSEGFAYYLAKVTYLGWIGVDLFFVLSGFLIGSIIYNNIGSKTFFRVFYIKRFYRIVPPYFLLLISFYIIHYWSGISGPFFDIHSEVPFISYFFFVQNFIMGTSVNMGSPALSPTWSICIEEQFYLIYPVVFILFGKKRVIYYLLGAIVISIGFRFYYESWIESYVFFHSRLDGLSMGILLAILYNSEEHWKRFLRYKRFFMPFLLIITMLVAIAFMVFKGLGPVNHLLFSLIFSILIIIILSESNPFIVGVFSSGFLRLFGKYSYFLYLFHYMILGVIYNLQGRLYIGIYNFYDVLSSILAILLTFFLAKLSYNYLEHPLIKRGSNLNYSS